VNEPINNLELWDKLKGVDRSFTKKIIGKTYGGDSPNPTYVIQKITEELGPIGIRWGFNVVASSIRYGKPHLIVIEKKVDYDVTGKIILSQTQTSQIVREEYHEVEIAFWLEGDNGRRTFSAFGGTPMLYMSRKGEWIHDEDAAKKSLTDAYVKAASWLGCCADIFLGLFDDKFSKQAPSESSVGETMTPGKITPADEGDW
jgi:hypothetical protein